MPELRTESKPIYCTSEELQAALQARIDTLLAAVKASSMFDWSSPVAPSGWKAVLRAVKRDLDGSLCCRIVVYDESGMIAYKRNIRLVPRS